MPETATAPAVPAKGESHLVRWLLVGLALVLVAAGVAGVVIRIRARDTLREDTVKAAVTVVKTVKPSPAPAETSITLPGTVQPWQSAAIYARTSGYLRKWYADIGAHVKQGQRLAELDTPEVDNQLAQGRAQLKTDEANAGFAQKTNGRYQGLVSKHLVEEQLGDQFENQATTAASNADADRANVKRLESLLKFQNIDAPFDGVVTLRTAQVGALVDSGASGGPLFQVADTSKLRIFIDVPEAEARAVTVGVAATITLSIFGGKPIDATVTRSASVLDPVTRTLRAEIDIDNPNGLVPGTFAQVKLSVSAPSQTVILPSNALLFRSEGLQVAVMSPQKRIHLQPITLGRDFGKTVEVLTGVDANSEVVLNPTDSLADGQEVRLAVSDAPKDPPKKD